MIASAGLLVAAAIPLGKDALTDAVNVAIAVVSFGLLLRTKIDTLWIILGAQILSSAHALAVVHSLA